jgi:hypothetical protein
MKLIDNTLSVSQFRREIHDFVVANMNKFVGASADGKDAIFQYPWGQMMRLKKQGCNPETSRTRFMTTEVMSGIWRERIDYSSPVGRAHWMDSGYLLPIIAYKYKMRKVVLYDNSGTDTASIDGGRCFTTYVSQQIPCLDWFMTLMVLAVMHALFSFVSNNILCCLSILIHVHSIYVVN